MSSCKSQDPVDAIVNDVRQAGDAAGEDEKAAKAARRQRAADPAVLARISAIHEGSPAGIRLRAELGALGIAAGALKAGLKWLRENARPAREEPRAERRESPEMATDARPEIEIVPDLHLVAHAAVGALRADPDLYHRDGALVHVLRARAEDERPGLMRGTPLLRTMAAPTLTLRLSAAAVWTRMGKKGPIVTTPHGAVVAGVLAMGEWDGLRPMVGIVERPSLRPDGTVIDEPGYDPATGFLYCPNAKEFSA